MPFESLYPRNLFGTPSEGETFAGLGQEADAETDPALRRIAAKIGATRRPGAASDIPAGATYLAQFASHDLDFRGRVGDAEHGRLDLGLIYGDGPKHDTFCYQLPERRGAPRHLLRVGRTRPSPDSPAAARISTTGPRTIAPRRWSPTPSPTPTRSWPSSRWSGS